MRRRRPRQRRIDWGFVRFLGFYIRRAESTNAFASLQLRVRDVAHPTIKGNMCPGYVIYGITTLLQRNATRLDTPRHNILCANMSQHSYNSFSGTLASVFLSSAFLTSSPPTFVSLVQPTAFNLSVRIGWL